MNSNKISTLSNRNINKIIPFAIEKLNLKQKYKSIPYQMMIYGLVRVFTHF
jgi:hypothetical protein